MKTYKTGRKVLLWALLLGMILALAACGGSTGAHELEEPSLDISGLTKAQWDEDGALVIDGVTYRYYATTAALKNPEFYDVALPGSFAIGQPKAYSLVEFFYCYYAEIQGLDPSQWLIRVDDDQSGGLNLSASEEIFKAVDVHEIPEWMENAKRAYEESIAPGSYKGLAEGDVLVP